MVRWVARAHVRHVTQRGRRTVEYTRNFSGGEIEWDVQFLQGDTYCAVHQRRQVATVGRTSWATTNIPFIRVDVP